MSSLLDAANVVSNKIEVIDQLPAKVGDVSIMTIEQVFNALENSNHENTERYHYDSSFGYDTSMYYVYGIFGSNGINSTIEDLQAIDLDWYKQFNKPTDLDPTFTNDNQTIFGGPLYGVYYDGSSDYRFDWYYGMSSDDLSDHSGYRGSFVSPSIYVAVVRAHE